MKMSILRPKSEMATVDFAKSEVRHLMTRDEEEKKRTRKFNDRLKEHLTSYFTQYKREMLRMIPDSSNPDYLFIKDQI